MREHTVDSAAWAFAAPWGADWLRRATPGTPTVAAPVDFSQRRLARRTGPEAPHIRALELFCGGAGVRMLSLSAGGAADIRDASAMHRPDLVVLAGGHMPDDTVATWTHSVRVAAGPIPIALYRRGDHLTGMPTAGTSVSAVPCE